MTRKLLWLALCTALLVIVGCQKPPQLTITSPPTVDLSVDGSSGTITFTANRDWTISTSDSWVSVSPKSGEASKESVTVKVSCNANTTYEDRSATVTIRMEELTQAVTITQPANLGIILPSKSFNLESSAKTIEVEVQANVQYSVTTSVDWIKQTGTKGLTSTKYTFSVEENTTYDDREGTITIKSQNSSVADQVINVKQAQKDIIIVQETEFDMSFGGGELDINVETNVYLDVIPSIDWIHFVETKALNSSIIRLNVDENRTYEKREGKIKIAQKNGELSHSITVVQAGRKIAPLGAVDLGTVMTREDGSKYQLFWAECNLGSDTPEGYGDYYAWGELETKGEYAWWTYKWCNETFENLTKYNTLSSCGIVDNKTVLEIEDDVAHVKLGDGWRMPSGEEWFELICSCNWTWTSQNGQNGMLVTSDINGNSIFLPAAGFLFGRYPSEVDSFGNYWASNIHPLHPYNAGTVTFYSGDVYSISDGRMLGKSVRPVSE